MGIDLSSSVERTALAVVEWDIGAALVGAPSVGLVDEELVQRSLSAEWLGIDAPFGWPAEMAMAVSAYARTGRWAIANKDGFRFRRTESFVRDKIFAETGFRFAPVSVAASRLSLTTFRLAQLRERRYEYFGFRFDLAGLDQVLEVHSMASLLFWGLPRVSYKTSRRAAFRVEERSMREELLSSLEEAASWLSWAPGARELCIESDDALDAVLAALVARAAALGLTVVPSGEDLDPAREEGWIHLPSRNSLIGLCQVDWSVDGVFAPSRLFADYDQLRICSVDFELEAFQCAVARLEAEVFELMDPSLGETDPVDFLERQAILYRLAELRSWARAGRARVADLAKN